jgi:hypothetical protein
MKSQKLYEPPLIIEYLRPQDSHYNFNVIETIVEEDGNEPYSVFNYDQVFVNNPVTRQGIKDSVEKEYNLAEWELQIDKDCDELGIN